MRCNLNEWLRNKAWYIYIFIQMKNAGIYQVENYDN